jgi:ribosome-associated protein
MEGTRRIKTTSVNSKKLAVSIAKIASDKIAEDILVLDMRKVVNFCDYFVICSGNTDRQVKAIADAIESELKEQGNKVSMKEGAQTSDWIVFDLGDVVAHIFQKKLREFYQLEYLWREAPVIPWESKKI